MTLCNAINKTDFNYFRKSAIESLAALMQIHDKADFNDIVLRDQISKIVFLVLPQISAVLFKVCQEETLRGSSLVQAATKTLGRYFCLIFENYEKTSVASITNVDFMNLVQNSEVAKDFSSVLQPKNQSQVEFVMNLKKSNEWLHAAANRLAPSMDRLKVLRGSEHSQIRKELATLSWNLLDKCLTNVRCFVPFLLENLVLFADDADKKIREFSQTSLKNLSETLPELNQEISQLFSSHLTIMPRTILTGDESEQIAGFTLLNSFIITITEKNSPLNSLLDNSVTLEKLLNVMLSSCEINMSNDLLFYENLASGALDDQFYQMKTPWKQFKNLKNKSIVEKFSEICSNLGRSTAAQVCINHLLDDMNSIEYLVLLIEILVTDTTFAQDQVEGIVEEFLSETYWTMKIQATARIEKKQRPATEEWYKDNTLGLYESAIEIRLRDVALEEDGEKTNEMNLKAIKYNIICTSLVLELMGTTAKVLTMNFQRFMLRTLHRVLEKAGSSNFIIRSAGLYALEMISTAMGFSEVSQLIDENSNFLLFNIQKLLKRSHEDEAVFDMLSVVFKFSKNSMTSYIKDIVETVAEQITCNRFRRNTSGYLKLFLLYAGSIKKWEENCDKATENTVEVTVEWDEFLGQCIYELENSTQDDDSCSLKEVDDEAQPTIDDNIEQEQPEEPQSNDENQLPPHIELIVKILTSTLQFFASANPSEVILTHEIFIDSFPVLQRYENHFLPMVHQMWYPFMKQFEVKNLVTLQHSFRLLTLIAQFAKDFVHKKTTENVFPIVNKFLTQSLTTKASKSNLCYTQEFKLQREILSNYGSLAVDLNVGEKDLDGIVEILLKYSKNPNASLVSASKISLEVLRNHNPGLIFFKMKF